MRRLTRPILALALATAFTIGLAAFTPVYGCGGRQGGSDCKTPSGGSFPTWLFGIQVLIESGALLLP
jgi:hypothetical protein